MKRQLVFGTLMIVVVCLFWFGSRPSVNANGGPPPRWFEWSPDGTRIAFAWYSTANYADSDIYLVDVDGNNLRNLTNTPDSSEYFFNWLADSQHLLVDDYQGSAILSADNGERVPLDDYYSTSMSISPDRRWLAYRTNTEPPDVIVTSMDGSQRTNLTEGMGLNFIPDVRWFPDGQRLLFYAESDSDLCSLFMADANGDNLQSITDSVYCPYYAKVAISPDNRHVAAIIRVDTDSLNAVVFDTVDGTQINLYERFGSSVHTGGGQLIVINWSPDGSYLFLGSLFLAQMQFVPPVFLYDSSNRRMINLGEMGSHNLFGSVTWSPDGRYLLLTGAADMRTLYVFDTQTQSLSRPMITDDNRYSYCVDWSPDSGSLLVSRNNGPSTREALTILSPNGTVLQQIETQEREVFECAWSADGEYFTFHNGSEYYQSIFMVGNAAVNNTYPLLHRPLVYGEFVMWSPTGHQIAVNGDDGFSLYEVGEGGATRLWLVTPDTPAPLNEFQYYDLAIAAAYRGEDVAAIEAYSAALELNPTMAAAYLGRATVYNRMGDDTAALADYWQYIQLSANWENTSVTTTRMDSTDATLDGLSLHDVVHIVNFEGTAGQVFSATAEPVGGGQVDPLMVLATADNTPLVADDDSGGDLKASIHSFVLPADGVYSLWVAQAGGSAVGNISVSVRIQNPTESD